MISLTLCACFVSTDFVELCMNLFQTFQCQLMPESKISLSLRKSLLWEIVTITLSIWHVQWWGTGGKGMLKQEHTRNTLWSQETKHTRNTGKTPEENAEHRLLQENLNFHFKPEQDKRITWCRTHETVLEQEMGTDSRSWVSCSLTCAASLCKHLGL